MIFLLLAIILMIFAILVLIAIIKALVLGQEPGREVGPLRLPGVGEGQRGQVSTGSKG